MVVFSVDNSQAADGILALNLTASQTSGMSAGLWDLQGTYGQTVITRGGGGGVGMNPGLGGAGGQGGSGFMVVYCY